jgi:ADP-heptose:LPS heptosyltransferase
MGKTLILRRRMQIASAAILRKLGNALIEAARLMLWPRRRPLTAERICVCRIGAIGDLVCAAPALFAIRRAYPGAHLTLLTTPGKYRGAHHAQELFGSAEWLDEIIVYEIGDIATMKNRLAFAKQLRARKFDLWFDLPLDSASFARMLRDLVLARLLGVRWAFGWRLDHVKFAARAEAEALEFPDEVERLARVLGLCGIDGATTFPPLIDDVQDRLMTGILRDFEADGRPMVAIAPAARRSCNLWTVEKFGQVCGSLIAIGAAVFTIGGAADFAMCEQICSRAGDIPENLAGKLSLMQTGALLRRCDLLICVDSGPQHLAAAVGTRCVALFSRRNQRRRWYPHGRGHIVLEAEVECHTCLLDTCPYDNRCMKLIDVDRVLEAAHSILRQTFAPGIAELERPAAAK